MNLWISLLPDAGQLYGEALATALGAFPDDFQITLGNPVAAKMLVISFQDPLARDWLIFIHLPRKGEYCFSANDLCQSWH
jgi:hypothetical protein